MVPLPAGRNFKIGYKNIQGLHGRNGCKIAEWRKEFQNDCTCCTCDKIFDGYDLLAEIKTQKLKGVKKVGNQEGSSFWRKNI